MEGWRGIFDFDWTVTDGRAEEDLGAVLAGDDAESLSISKWQCPTASTPSLGEEQSTRACVGVLTSARP